MLKVKIGQLLLLLIFFGGFVSAQDEDGVDQLQNSDDVKLDFLLEWAKENGASLHFSAVKKHPLGGYGIFATKDLSAGKTLITVPKKLFFDVEHMENSLNADIYAQIKELTGDNWAGLVCFLLHEKFLNKDSFWKTLLDILPETLPNPHFWPKESLDELLKGTWAYELIQYDLVHVKTQFSNLNDVIFENHRDLFPESIFTFENYLWATAIFWSRAYRLTGDNFGTVPVSLFLNHQNQPNVEVKVTDSRLQLKAIAPIKAGEELVVSYQRISNVILLKQYGFVLPDNEFNIVALNVTLDPNDPTSSTKYQALLESKLITPPYPYNHELYFSSKDTINIAVILLLNIKYHGDPQYDVLATNDLSNVVSTAFHRIPFEIEDDRKLLENPNLSTMERSAIQVRMEEKDMLYRLQYSTDFKVVQVGVQQPTTTSSSQDI